MIRNLLSVIVFAIGLMAVLWIGLGYIGHNTVGASVALLIGVCYCLGGWELLGFQRSTRTLASALASAPTERPAVPTWLQQLPSTLRAPVGLRLQGERVALPGPALTPYLVGLLVLLGMLGTLLGMMATLRGTGIALESATDLQAIRGSLASPVEGLAVAFGTSIAGVAASAMLGLLSALLRRERAGVVQQLDLRVTTDLHVLTRRHLQDEHQQLLRRQAEAMPALVERLQQLADAVQQQGSHSHATLLQQQAAHHVHTDQALQALAGSLEQALQRSITDAGARMGATLQPLLKQALHSLADDAKGSQAAVAQAAGSHLQALQDGLESLRTQAADGMRQALSQQQTAQAGLLDALKHHLQAGQEQQLSLHQQVQAEADTARQAANAELLQALQTTTEHHQAALQALLAGHVKTVDHANAAQEQRVSALIAQLAEQAGALQETLQAADERRLQHWSSTLNGLVEVSGTQLAAQAQALSATQSQLGAALEQTASAVSAQLQSQAAATMTEITRLLDAASAAPRAAAEVVGELRQRLSDSLARDTAVLAERNQLLQTLQTLLEGVNAAAAEQRNAVDALVGSAATMFAAVDQRIGHQLDAGARQMELVAKRVGHAGDSVASMAGTLQVASEGFSASSSALSEHLQQLSGALDASLLRSDEQLAYYVAQAREVVDLSLLSQKQITEELQQLARGPRP